MNPRKIIDILYINESKISCVNKHLIYPIRRKLTERVYGGAGNVDRIHTT